MERKHNRLLLPAFLLLVFLLFVLLHDLFGGSLLASSSYNSYTLQSLSWLKGKLALDKDYPWLELAVYGGKYYVSFPPVPSVLMLPFAAIFGERTPDNLIIAGLCLAAIALGYGIFRRAGLSERRSVFFSAFLILGSNLLWMCTDGSVWFLAQALNIVLCLAAIFAAQRSRRALSLFFAALAVGCRPFSVLLFLPLLWQFFEADRHAGKPLGKTLPGLLKVLVPAMLVAAAYCAFNYARFGSPLVFGHRYLPEFSAESQFSLSNIPGNLKNLFRPVVITRFLQLEYPIYDGFLFFVANPFFVLLALRVRKPSAGQWIALGCLVINLLLLTMHRTLGGWQFGARYTVDLLPYAVLALLPALGEKPVRNAELLLCAFAILFNLYGAIAMHTLYY